MNTQTITHRHARILGLALLVLPALAGCLAEDELDTRDEAAALEAVMDEGAVACDGQVHLASELDEDEVEILSAGEILDAAEGLELRPLEPGAEVSTSVRIAAGVDPRLELSSLCVDTDAGLDEVVLRECGPTEPSLGDLRAAEAPSTTHAMCYWCTNNNCLFGGKKKKQGIIVWCGENFAQQCCAAVYAGCCG